MMDRVSYDLMMYERRYAQPHKETCKRCGCEIDGEVFENPRYSFITEYLCEECYNEEVEIMKRDFEEEFGD